MTDGRHPFGERQGGVVVIRVPEVVDLGTCGVLETGVEAVQKDVPTFVGERRIRGDSALVHEYDELVL